MRGISPVVATILLVVIAITAAVVAYSWFASIQGSLQAKASQHLSAVSGVAFTIVVAECNDSNEVNVVILNLSDEGIATKGSALLLGADGSVLDVNSEVDVNVPARGIQEISIGFNTNCSTAEAVTVTVGPLSATAPLR